jgi:hypothetical protein
MVMDRAKNGIKWTASVQDGPFEVRGDWLVPTDTVGFGTLAVSTDWGSLGTVQVQACLTIYSRRQTLYILPEGANPRPAEECK